MPILKVRYYPDPLLKRPAETVDVRDAAVRSFMDDLAGAMAGFAGCVGLAAPQVGRSWRVIAVDASRARKDPGRHHGAFVLANPEIVRADGAQLIREGCLSVPHYTGNVRRAERVTVEGLDREGKRVTIEARDFEAVVLQHELDHVNGLLFLDRLISRSDLFRRKSYL